MSAFELKKHVERWFPTQGHNSSKRLSEEGFYPGYKGVSIQSKMSPEMMDSDLSSAIIW